MTRDTGARDEWPARAAGVTDGVRLAIVGTGYVGLVASAGFAELGHRVACVDRDRALIARLRRGEVPIHEPGLEELVRGNLAAGRLRFTVEMADAVAGAEVVVVAVGTPQGEGGAADVSAIEEVARQLGGALERTAPGREPAGGDDAAGAGEAALVVVAIKSTVPVGTAERVAELIGGETTRRVAVAANPEFLAEGDALDGFMRPMRIIVGSDDPRAREVLARLYAPFTSAGYPMIAMDARSAELTKYAANAMLAVRISFMNELAALAEQVGADVERVRVGMGSDPRIGPDYLSAGAGFGGSCFPKDLRALAHTAGRCGLRLGVVAAADEANQRQQRRLGRMVAAHFDGDLAGRRVAIWGLAFKPGTDDVREAPALILIDQLLAAGAQVVAHDPAAMERVRGLRGTRVELVDDMYQAAAGAHALVLVTEWPVFRDADFARVAAVMAEPVVFDGRNLWDPDQLGRRGFHYRAIGRGRPARR